MKNQFSCWRFSSSCGCNHVGWLVALAIAMVMIHSCSSFQIVLPSSSSGTATPRPSKVLLYATKSRNQKSGRSPSRVSDPTGPTPEEEEVEDEVIALDDIPELEYNEAAHPVPYQPWRRGETNGCEDPIDAPWRQEAEEIMTKAVSMIGGTLLDVTWYLTSVVVTIDDEWARIPENFVKENGPVINVFEAKDPQYTDPEDPKPEEIWADEFESDIVYSKDVQAEEDLKRQMYARKEDDEPEMEHDPDEDVSLYMDEESKIDDALRFTEEMQQRAEEAEKPLDPEYLSIDTAAISTIAGAILDSLETVEDKLRVLERHEVILTSPAQAMPDVLESQRQFDNARGLDVTVETQDPWESNRTLRGKLIDRNSMDILINQKGRMVTIPQNFVKCVRLRHRAPVAEIDAADEEGSSDVDLDDFEV